MLCVANTVLAEFWANMVGNTRNVIAGFPPVKTFTLGAANGSCEPIVTDAAACANV